MYSGSRKEHEAASLRTLSWTSSFARENLLLLIPSDLSIPQVIPTAQAGTAAILIQLL